MLGTGLFYMKLFKKIAFVLFTGILLSLCFKLLSTQKTNSSILLGSINTNQDSLKKTKEYLELKALVNYLKPKIKNSIAALDSAQILIYTNNQLFAEYHTNTKGKCTFILPLDKIYRIDITKKGYATKFIEVNTMKIPKSKRGIFSFPFEVDLFLLAPGLDISILKKPIAKLKYNGLYNQFDYDANYTNSMNQELIKLHENYYLMKQIDKDIDSVETENKKTEKKK